MRKTQVLIYFLLVLPYFLCAQDSYKSFSFFEKEIKPAEKFTDIFFLSRPSSEAEIQDQVYLSDAWEESLILDQNDHFYKVPARYSVSSGTVEIFINKNIYIIHPIKIDAVEIGNQLFIYQSSIDDESQNLGYLQILAKGRYMLYANYHIEASRNSAQKQFYIKDTTQEEPSFIKLKRNKKSILKLFKDKADRIKEFINENDIKFSNENDLVTLFNFYNNL